MSVRQGNKVIAGGNSITVDQALDINSPNPIANSAVTAGLNGKEPTITGAATTITTNNLTAARAVITDANGKVAVSAVTSTELGYVHGVTSAIQTQLDNKQAVLVSGTNIKTINGTSVLGSGDITISVAPDIDNSTITKNGDDELQTVATVNANVAVGATNPIYDWVGTLAEYQAQNIETLHPDWVCYITDDFSAQAYDAYSKGQSDNLFVTKGHQVIEFQEPTTANGYTWYRKYADGWVEQGGLQTSATGSSGVTVTLPVAMSDANYTITATVTGQQSYFVGCINKTTTSFLWRSFNANVEGYDKAGSWQVSGIAA